MTNHFDRRTVLQGMTAVTSAGLLSRGGLAFAQAGEIAATSFPGAWEQAIRSIVLPVFKERTGATPAAANPAADAPTTRMKSRRPKLVSLVVSQSGQDRENMASLPVR